MLDRYLDPSDFYDYECEGCKGKKSDIDHARWFLKGYMQKLMDGDKVGALQDLDEACGYLDIGGSFVEKFYDFVNI